MNVKIKAKIRMQKLFSATSDATFQEAIHTYKTALENRIEAYKSDIEEKEQQISDTREILDDLDNLADAIPEK